MANAPKDAAGTGASAATAATPPTQERSGENVPSGAAAASSHMAATAESAENMNVTQAEAAPVGQTLYPTTVEPGYHAITTGQPVDLTAVQAAAIAQQQAMYTGVGAPYALNMGYPHGTSGAVQLYYPQTTQGVGAPGIMQPSQTGFLSGPCYYDPYGMLNPAASFVPMPIAPSDEHASTRMLSSAKKSTRWCC